MELATSQLGFINFMVAPMLNTVTEKVFAGLAPFQEMLRKNVELGPPSRGPPGNGRLPGTFGERKVLAIRKSKRTQQLSVGGVTAVEDACEHLQKVKDSRGTNREILPAKKDRVRGASVYVWGHFFEPKCSDPMAPSDLQELADLS